jgi:SAM-dependent methyltransferase
VSREVFFADQSFDDELAFVNRAFWEALIEHIERDISLRPRTILDVGCHSGGLLRELARRFSPDAIYGLEPIVQARDAAIQLLLAAAPRITMLDPRQWDAIPAGSCDLIVSHEMLYLERDLCGFMTRVRNTLSVRGNAYIVLGSHTENPLWSRWKPQLLAAGHEVFDHRPLDIMAAASSAGLLPSVQPLRHTGWVTYDPNRATFAYPDVRTMFEHHFRFKLIFRMSQHDG